MNDDSTHKSNWIPDTGTINTGSVTTATNIGLTNSSDPYLINTGTLTNYDSGGTWSSEQLLELNNKDLEDRLEDAENAHFILLYYAEALKCKKLKDNAGLGMALVALGRELATGWDMSWTSHSTGRMYHNGSFQIYVKVTV